MFICVSASATVYFVLAGRLSVEDEMGGREGRQDGIWSFTVFTVSSKDMTEVTW